MIWFFAAGFLAMLVISVNEANDLRQRLVEEQIAHGVALEEYGVVLERYEAAMATIDAERRAMATAPRPTRLSCSFYHDQRNHRRITLYLN